jgi:hypothetical protein
MIIFVKKVVVNILIFSSITTYDLSTFNFIDLLISYCDSEVLIWLIFLASRHEVCYWNKYIFYHQRSPVAILPASYNNLYHIEVDESE